MMPVIFNNNGPAVFNSVCVTWNNTSDTQIQYGMHKGVRDYIKRSFSVETEPPWTPQYEGTILFIKSTQELVVGDNFGWTKLIDL